MSKEKFEVLFLGGGALLDVLRNRLRRPAANPREAIGAAMHELTMRFVERRDELADPDAATRELYRIRELLSGPAPDTTEVAGHIERFVALAGPDGGLARAARGLDDAVRDWLR